jgi:hypothetical protein
MEQVFFSFSGKIDAAMTVFFDQHGGVIPTKIVWHDDIGRSGFIERVCF